MCRRDVVAFVEVKTRIHGPQDPSLTLSHAQRRRLRRAAEAWIHSHPTVGREFRFDLVTVEFASSRGGSRTLSGEPHIRHIEGAFYGDDAR